MARPPPELDEELSTIRLFRRDGLRKLCPELHSEVRVWQRKCLGVDVPADAPAKRGVLPLAVAFRTHDSLGGLLLQKIHDPLVGGAATARRRMSFNLERKRSFENGVLAFAVDRAFRDRFPLFLRSSRWRNHGI